MVCNATATKAWKPEHAQEENQIQTCAIGEDIFLS
jgi:hypothetical protein